MDIIQHCLSLVPVPYLSPAFSAFRFLWQSMQQVRTTREQLKFLGLCISQLLCALDSDCQTMKQMPANVAKLLQDLCSLLKEVNLLVQKQSNSHFLKALLRKDEWISQIAGYHHQIEAFVAAFQVSAEVNIVDWQERNDRARLADQQALDNRLTELEGNLAEILDIHHNSVMAMMTSLQRRLDSLDRQPAHVQESRFMEHSLQYLSTVSESQVIMEDWMVTAFDVDFGPKIGEGGFGMVFKGTWNKLPVALKVLTADGISPTSAAIRREIKIWSDLRHPHVLQFLGANIFDEKPFIVMPLVTNGNARDYIEQNPDCDRQRILYHISLGLVYLHGRNLLHGDLKSFNVLIDDAENALLCDFGLSRIKADVTSRTVKQIPTTITGSRNWMAPERLKGGSLKKPADVYAFGMMVYEVHTNEIPLGDIPHSEFFDLVVNQGVRPERPDNDEAPQMTDESWQLAEDCWRKDPLTRPDIGAVCDMISRSLGKKPRQRVTKPPPPPPSPPLTRQPEVPVAQLTPSPSPKLRPAPHTFRETCRLKGHTGSVYCVTFSPDGERIASGSGDNTVRVWDWRNQKVLLGPLRGHTEAVWSVAYSPDGQKIASGSHDHTVLVWDAKSGSRLLRLAKHTGYVSSVAFSLDGRTIASGSDKTIKVWDARTGNVMRSLKLRHDVLSLVFSPNGQYLVSATEGRVEVWDVQNWWRVCGCDGCRVAVSPTSKQVAYNDLNDTGICIMDIKTAKPVVGPFQGPAGSIQCLAFSPDGTWIASGTFCAAIRIWDTASGNLISEFGNGTSIAISPNGMQMVAGNYSSLDYTVLLYSCDSVA